MTTPDFTDLEALIEGVLTLPNEDPVHSYEQTQQTHTLTPYEFAVHEELSQALGKALRTLNPREQFILAQRFGLLGGQDYTLEEVGQMLGVHRERVRQIEAKALRRLRHPTCANRLSTFTLAPVETLGERVALTAEIAQERYTTPSPELEKQLADAARRRDMYDFKHERSRRILKDVDGERYRCSWCGTVITARAYASSRNNYDGTWHIAAIGKPHCQKCTPEKAPGALVYWNTETYQGKKWYRNWQEKVDLALEQRERARLEAEREELREQELWLAHQERERRWKQRYHEMALPQYLSPKDGFCLWRPDPLEFRPTDPNRKEKARCIPIEDGTFFCSWCGARVGAFLRQPQHDVVGSCLCCNSFHPSVLSLLLGPLHQTMLPFLSREIVP